MSRASGRIGVRLKRAAAVLALTSTASLSACIHYFWRTEARRADEAVTGAIRTPVKAHLKDGSTVVFPAGATISRDRLTGVMQRFPLLNDDAYSAAQGTIVLDSVVAVETFERRVEMVKTVVVSTAATAVSLAATVWLAKAIFGSCPTVYADTGSGSVLEAEGFSYAIAPVFERRDVDPLRVRADASGKVRLELRNEALETHYLNQIELLAVRHAASEVVVPDQSGRVVALAALRPLERAEDRSGRDVRTELAEADGRLFATSETTSAAARIGDVDDWIDLETSGLPPGDSIAVVLRLRNSLLNTVLLYDGMLGGTDAVDWLAHDLTKAPNVAKLGVWYARTMGMHVKVDNMPGSGGSAAPSGSVHLADVGPIAFRDVAVVLPRPARDAGRVRVRLRFVVDNWRIDQVRVAGVVRRAPSEVLPVARVIVPVAQDGRGMVADTAAVRALAAADDVRLETRPGQRMVLEFDTRQPAVRGDSATRYLIAWRGWYQEWIRGAWLASPTRTAPFAPGDAALLKAIDSWRGRRAAFERAFYASRIPVR